MSKQIWNTFALSQCVLFSSIVGIMPAIAGSVELEQEIGSDASVVNLSPKPESREIYNFNKASQLLHLDSSLAQVPVNSHNGFGDSQPNPVDINS